MFEKKANCENIFTQIKGNNFDVTHEAKDYEAKHQLLGERLITTPTHFAYFKIAEGCERPCSFCAIPVMRVKHLSRPAEELVLEAKNLAKNGTKELILIAEDLTYSGLDLYKDRKKADLFRQHSDVEGIEWIRLQYAYPFGFPNELLISKPSMIKRPLVKLEKGYLLGFEMEKWEENKQQL